MKSEGLIQILLVEDDDDHAEIVARGLATSGMDYGLQRLADGEAALDYLFRRGHWADPALSPRPSVILLDLRLPRVDGCEVLRIIKESAELRGIPVVILTTSDAERDLITAYGNYANSYLVKPVVFGEFAEMMQTLGFYWLTLNQIPQDPDREPAS
jgi:DNA-binding response OmpR family regulator